MLSKIRLAAFDLDGTLFDTGTANFLAYRDACAGHTDIDESFFRRECFGKNYREFLPLLGISDSDAMEAIHREKTAAYPRHFGDIRVNFRLFDMARLLKENGAALALVTTASRDNTNALLSHFGYESFFDLLVTQETVGRPKPFPDAYIYAMEHFGADKENTIIFEDSATGIEAARGSGAAVYKIIDF